MAWRKSNGFPRGWSTSLRFNRNIYLRQKNGRKQIKRFIKNNFVGASPMFKNGKHVGVYWHLKNGSKWGIYC